MLSLITRWSNNPSWKHFYIVHAWHVLSSFAFVFESLCQIIFWFLMCDNGLTSAWLFFYNYWQTLLLMPPVTPSNNAIRIQNTSSEKKKTTTDWLNATQKRIRWDHICRGRIMFEIKESSSLSSPSFQNAHLENWWK